MESERFNLTWADITSACDALSGRWNGMPVTGVYGVPTGGAPVAVAVANQLRVPLMDTPGRGTLVVDDLVDSGKTLGRYVGTEVIGVDALYRKPWSPLHLAPDAEELEGWLVFPWEHTGAPEDAVVRLLSYIGEDPNRDGLVETPGRVCRALREMTAGYALDPKTILATSFDCEYDEMVIVRGVPFTSMCEHHMLPFTGHATVAYIPRSRVCGLSKLVRLVDVYARRLQMQERMTMQIADALEENLDPLGIGVVVKGVHSCMSCRGVNKAGEMVTSALRGAMLDTPQARAEFMSLAG